MIRPRAGDFFYSEEELSVMLEDIRLFKDVGIVGVVVGVLNPDGTVDVPHTRMYVFALKLINMTLCTMTAWWKLHFLCKVCRRLGVPKWSLELSTKCSIAVCFHRAFDMTRSAIEGVFMKHLEWYDTSGIDDSFVPNYPSVRPNMYHSRCNTDPDQVDSLSVFSNL